MQKKHESKRSRLWRDLLVIGVFLFVSVTALCLRAALRTDGGSVQVTVDGTVTACYSLSENRTVRLEDGNGGYNLLVIRDGVADVTEANCPDILCVHQHPIRYCGETIVCLPHKTVITVIGGADGDLLN